MKYEISNTSKDVIKLLKTNIESNSNINNHLTKCLKINSSNSQMLSKMYKNLIEKYKYFNQNIKVLLEKISDNNNHDNSDHDNNPFVGENVKGELNKMNFKVKITYFDEKTNLRVVFFLTIYNKQKFEKLKNLLFETASRVLSLNSLFLNIKEIIYFISPTNLKKCLSKNNLPLSGDNINSGSTLAIGLGPINLWRREELLKVAIHELIHCLKFDIKNYPAKELKRYYENFCINDLNCENNFPHSCDTSIFPNEGYTEIMAQIINTMFYYYHNTSGYTKNNLNTKLFLSILSIELLWGFIQINKILKHYKFHNINTFFYEKNKSKNRNPEQDVCISRLVQYTNVFSYFFIRIGLYSNFNKFLSFIRLNNINFMKFNENDEILNKFTTLAIDSIKSNNMIIGVNINLNLFEYMKKNKVANKSMRMSILE